VGSEEPAAEWAIRRTTSLADVGILLGVPGIGQRVPAWRRVSDRNFAAAVYGSVLAAAVVASLDVGDVGAVVMTASLGGTMAVFYLSHVWSEAISDRMHDPRPYSWARLRAVALWHWPMLPAATGPLLSLALADLGVWSRATAVTVALAISVVQLVGWGIAVGRRTFESWPAALLTGLADGLLGVALVVLKSLVH